mgnify:FL=1
MYDKRISKYLVKIVNGDAINFATFLTFLPESLREDVKHNATVKPQKGGLSLVEIPCVQLNEQLKQLTKEPDKQN